jgi:dienelactone hydrolase
MRLAPGIFMAASLAVFAGEMSAVRAGEPSADIPARIELHPIPTLTLSDQQFLKGEGGTPVTVTGELRLAQGSGRLPAVILMHGSGGVGANIEMWSRELNRMGISTFAIDGFTGRGIVQVSTNQARLGRLNFILDIYRALGILGSHPRVDPARIALMGFSRGGQAALYASLKRFHRLWNTSGVEFAAYVPFYPDCMTTYDSDTETADRPIRIVQGTVDDYNPVAPCKAYVARLRAAGRDAVLTEYPNAPHAFDNPLAPVPPAVSKESQSVRNCRIKEDAAGTLINTATAQPFSYKDACVALGPHLGYDAEATQAAKQAVTDLLRSTLKLP